MTFLLKWTTDKSTDGSANSVECHLETLFLHLWILGWKEGKEGGKRERKRNGRKGRKHREGRKGRKEMEGGKEANASERGRKGRLEG